MGKKKSKCVISMSLALEFIEQATKFKGVSPDLADTFLRSVIFAVMSRDCITEEFFSVFGEAGRKMYELLNAALIRSDRARAGAAKRKMKKKPSYATENKESEPSTEKSHATLTDNCHSAPATGRYAAISQPSSTSHSQAANFIATGQKIHLSRIATMR